MSVAEVSRTASSRAPGGQKPSDAPPENLSPASSLMRFMRGRSDGANRGRAEIRGAARRSENAPVEDRAAADVILGERAKLRRLDHSNRDELRRADFDMNRKGATRDERTDATGRFADLTIRQHRSETDASIAEHSQAPFTVPQASPANQDAGVDYMSEMRMQLQGIVDSL